MKKLNRVKKHEINNSNGNFKIGEPVYEIKLKLKSVELLILTLTLLFIVIIAILKVLTPVVFLLLIIDVSLLLLYYARLSYSINGEDLNLNTIQNYLIYFTPESLAIFISFTFAVILFLVVDSLNLMIDPVIIYFDVFLSLGTASLIALAIYLLLEFPSKIKNTYYKHKQGVFYITMLFVISLLFFFSLTTSPLLSTQPVKHSGLQPFNLWYSSCNSTDIGLTLTNGGTTPLLILNATIQSKYYSKSNVSYIYGNRYLLPDNLSANSSSLYSALVQRNGTSIIFPSIICKTENEQYDFNITISYSVQIGQKNLTVTSYGDIFDVASKGDIYPYFLYDIYGSNTYKIEVGPR